MKRLLTLYVGDSATSADKISAVITSFSHVNDAGDQDLRIGLDKIRELEATSI